MIVPDATLRGVRTAVPETAPPDLSALGGASNLGAGGAIQGPPVEVQAPTPAVSPAAPPEAPGASAQAASAGFAQAFPASSRPEVGHPLHPMRVLAWPLRALVFLYQRLISPALPPACRYYPSCSEYAAEALATHGAVKGTLLAAHRLLRCHPWCEGGFDPVPQRACARRRQKLAQHPRHG